MNQVARRQAQKVKTASRKMRSVRKVSLRSRCPWSMAESAMMRPFDRLGLGGCKFRTGGTVGSCGAVTAVPQAGQGPVTPARCRSSAKVRPQAGHLKKSRSDGVGAGAT
jgi:hypothetical protein